ncbi:hypothetical protein DFJ58DRAFT_719454 [Suillus subalutaceus]|uniref:uncharacterized protein n=1 Tax=Suillus subalutaceus TaxID=48586 RepID=UPI001B86674D|nr:uncharacterized protein DFJ58DRAFT_719454 [Suillus subalutaceus]KAG1833244.1 hypothetical protein DFJ58DRAFT_719454 [Suillus subalutaceus]
MSLPAFRPRKYYCTDAKVTACCRGFKTLGGYQQHRNALHIEPPQPTRPRQHTFSECKSDAAMETGHSDNEDTYRGSYYCQHPVLDGSPCDAVGNYLLSDGDPPILDPPAEDNPWAPFQSLSLKEFNGKPPFHSDTHIYDTIDAISLGNISWQSLSLKHAEFETASPDDALWKCSEYELANPDFVNDIDYSAQQVFGEQGQHVWSDLMTGNWAWDQSATEDPDCCGAMFVPIILGSDKTTVSMATGQNDFYPLYISAGNLRNNVRRAHKESVSLVGFLSIPKTERDHENSVEFRNFQRHIFHASLQAILEAFRPAMEKPEVVKCADGHFRHVVYGLGPYIANYPEQCLLACIIQRWCARCTADRQDLDCLASGRRLHQHTKALMHGYSVSELKDGWGILGSILPFTAYFQRADIHDLLAPDILHQIVKGTFKDHIVDWIGQYLIIIHGEAGAERIWADIDRRIAAVPAFPGLHHFPQGRKFKQWTGDDSKALMKVFLPAITGHVPDKMLRALYHFLDFCYLVRRSSLDEANLDAMDKALHTFHEERHVFKDVGVTPDGISLPQQHFLCHYRYLTQQFGAPNGLCSSLTECSSGYLPLGQMLVNNQQLDKLASFRAEKTAAGLLDQPLLPPDAVADDDNEAQVIAQLAKRRAHGYPQQLQAIGEHIGIPHFCDLRNPDHAIPVHEMDVSQCPNFNGKVDVFHSAVASFHAASDSCGVNGMMCHAFRAAPNWRGGFQGLYVAQVILLFSFTFRGVLYPCALIHWFLTIGNQPCPETGMWMVKPELDADTHLIPVYGSHLLPHDITHSDSLMAFEAFYINKYSDYHVFEIAF